MKYDPNKKQTRGVERTLKAFAEAMFDSLAEKPFDKITVNALCETADYPRATFYNYFDDKFDLLEFCWFKLGQAIHLDENLAKLDRISIQDTFAQVYNLFAENQPLLLNIVKNNPLDSQLVNHFLGHFTNVISDNIETNLDPKSTNIPMDLLAKHASSTVLEILEWIFLGQHQVSLEKAETYLEELLTGPIHITTKKGTKSL